MKYDFEKINNLVEIEINKDFINSELNLDDYLEKYENNKFEVVCSISANSIIIEKLSKEYNIKDYILIISNFYNWYFKRKLS